MMQILTKVFGTKNERDVRPLRPIVNRINDLEPALQKLTDHQLQMKTGEFRERLSRGQSVDELLPEAFAVCREAGKRVLGMRHYDVQLIGGMVLNKGAISEMKTGEGKTLVATLPMYLNALTGRGAHLVTVNDYLARRDADWMGQLYRFLGLSVGVIVHDLRDSERKAAYGSDITYGTNNEFGFDYLRDNMKFSLEDMVQREYHFAIVDECDSILVDEARTPLIISGPSEDSTDKYYEINKVIPHLRRDVHFTMEEKNKTVALTEEGNSRVEELLQLDNLYEAHNIEIVHHLYQGLKAHHLYNRDVDYMIRDGEVIIVDEFTGRLMPGRRWSDGLHQAIEAKENVSVRSENQTLATITFQNFFRMYQKLSGMTGTAETESVEFKKIYNLDVVVIPTHRPIARVDADDVVYKTEKAKFKAIVEDIKECNKKGQPVLVGTVSIEKSERLSRFLRDEGITHNVLNAKHHEREAEIVAQAGRYSSVTIATNMAGRGTDIMLGGNPEFLAKAQVNGEVEQEGYEPALRQFRAVCADEKDRVRQAGGLYIIGTERHESRRIDNQLRGRSGRQGDPGLSRFYLSLEDNLMRIFNGERIQKIMTTLKVPDDEPITARMVTRAIEGAQRKVEGHNFDIRKHLLEYDDVMNRQRNSVYGLRRRVLRGENLERLVLDFLGDVTTEILETYAGENVKPEKWDLSGLETALVRQFGLSLPVSSMGPTSVDQLTDQIAAEVKKIYERQKEELGEHFEDISRRLLLQVIDQNWKEHLYQVDRLKEGINLRAYAQKDPLVEYKKEAFRAFESMNLQIQSESIEQLLKIRLLTPEEAEREWARKVAAHGSPTGLSYQGPSEEDVGFFHDGGVPPDAAEAIVEAGFETPSRRTVGSREADGGRKMNRADRRRLEKMNKKKR